MTNSATGRGWIVFSCISAFVSAVTKRTAEGRHCDDYLETLAVYRKLTESLIDGDILLFRGSAVAVDGACYLFAGEHTMVATEGFSGVVRRNKT